MNEAKTDRKSRWKTIVANAGIVATIGLTGVSIQQTMELQKTMEKLQRTNTTLHETQDKVQVQSKVIKQIMKENKVLNQKVVDQEASIQKLSSDLQSAEQQKLQQQQKIQQLEIELKKKRASREASSATSANIAGMSMFRSTAYSYQDPNSAGGGVITASGTHVTEGRTIAVDPRLIPLGSKVQIVCPSYPSINGVYTAEDTGGAIKGNIIDIYLQSESHAIQYGRRTIYVKVLN